MRKLVIICLLAGAATVSADSGQRHPELYTTPEEKRDVQTRNINGLSLGALLEVEASYVDQGGEVTSDIILATFALGFEAQLNDWFQVSALLLWEEDDTEPIELDEAIITIGGNDETDFYAEAGKMYVPFGLFATHFISDPLVLELAETRESAFLVGYANDHVDIKAGAFKGDRIVSEEEKINNGAACVTVSACDHCDFGLYWISDIGESEVLEELIGESGFTNDMDRTEGLGGYVSLMFDSVSIELEYIEAVSAFDAGLLGDMKLRPTAWNAELSIVIGKSSEVGIKLEGTSDFPEMPEKQYGIAGSVRLAEKVTLSAEYLHGEYERGAADSDGVTVQLAANF